MNPAFWIGIALVLIWCWADSRDHFEAIGRKITNIFTDIFGDKGE